jgi:uncharacterized protein (TIRG00374 family)
MTVASKPRLSKKVLLFTCLGLLTLVAYFVYFVGTVNIVDRIKEVDLYYYASAFIAFLVSVLFSTLAWRSLLSNLSIKVTVRTALLFMWTGLFFDATVPDPGWSGDLSKAYMLAKTANLDTARIVASVVGQKIIGLAITVIDLLLGLVLLSRNYTLPGLVLIFIALVSFVSALSLFVLVYLSAKPKATKRILDLLIRAACFLRRGRWDPTDFRLKAEEMLNKYHENIRVLGSNLKTLARPVVFSLTSWAFDVSITFLTFASLHYPVPVDKVLIVYALTGSLQAVGVSFVGFTELVMSGSYTVLGIPAVVGLSATLLARVVTLWFKLVVAYFAFQWAGVKVLSDRRLPLGSEAFPPSLAKAQTEALPKVNRLNREQNTSTTARREEGKA